MADSPKNDLKPWLKQPWVIPPKANAAFVANREDVLEVYARPCDPKRPVVGVAEGGQQLIGDVREPRPWRPGAPAQQDYEYERGGLANLLLACAPLAGWRHVAVTQRKTAADCARFLRLLSDGPFRDGAQMVLVCDNLNTPTPASLDEAFEPAAARRRAERFAWHDTPQHGSWLNVAECALSVVARQCRDCRIPDLEALRRAVAAWEWARNVAAVRVDGQFTAADARIKLKRLYPTVQLQ